MRATGIVRRVDDLGRICIPKELRREMNVREGDPMEIFTQEGREGMEVVLCKYNVNQNSIAQGAVGVLEDFLDGWKKSVEERQELEDHIRAIRRILEKDENN